MYTLLKWLWERADKVYKLIGSYYYRIISAAINAYKWARNAYDDAISWSINKILYWYNRATLKAQALLGDVIGLIDEGIAKAVKVATKLFDDIVDNIDLAVDKLRKKVKSWVYDVTMFVDGLAKDLDLAIDKIIKKIKIDIGDVFEGVNLELVSLKERIEADIAKTLAKSGLVDEESQEQLRLFLGNPIGFTAAYMSSILLTMLECLIAYALGTVEATLPPPPIWGDNGHGGLYPGAPGPPPGASELAPPLGYLRRSGYPYSPRHRAADFGCTQDMQVYACHDGKVLVAGWSNVGYGYYVVIGNGEWWSLYAHLLQPFVRTGERVYARQPIGTCDTTGNSTGNHLHLELKYYGEFVSPYVVFGVEG